MALSTNIYFKSKKLPHLTVNADQCNPQLTFYLSTNKIHSEKYFLTSVSPNIFTENPIIYSLFTDICISIDYSSLLFHSKFTNKLSYFIIILSLLL